MLLQHFQHWPKDRVICVHAEEQTTAAVILLAQLYKRPIHVCHVARKEEVGGASCICMHQWVEPHAYVVICMHQWVEPHAYVVICTSGWSINYVVSSSKWSHCYVGGASVMLPEVEFTYC